MSKSKYLSQQICQVCAEHRDSSQHVEADLGFLLKFAIGLFSLSLPY